MSGRANGRRGRRAGTAAMVIVVATLCAVPARSAQYYFSVDVPTTIGPTTYTPDQILRVTGGVHIVEVDFEDNVELGAMHRMADGLWLLGPAHPIPTDDFAIEPRDLVEFDQVNDTGALVLDGSAVGIPDGAAIDAAHRDPITGQFVLSFDVPVTLAGASYAPSDLVAFGPGFTLRWSSGAAGVPASANLVAADVDGSGRLVMSFDAPVTLPGGTYLPGQLVRWAPGAGFSLFAADPGWPVSSVLANAGFLPAAGSVPDGGAGSVPLTVQRAGGNLILSWGASCSPTDDYDVYEGTLSAPFNSHLPVACSTSGATTLTFTPSAGNRYYLVVPRNEVAEGSYGFSSAMLPRPPSAAACRPQEVALVCP